MKKIVLLALTASFCAAAFAFDTETLAPSGSISSYTKTDYAVISKFGDYFRTPTVKHVHVYKNGKQAEVSSYAVKKTTDKSSVKEILIDKALYAYNEFGDVESITYYDSNENLIWKAVREYGSNGKIASESEYNADDILSGKTIYKYAENKVTESYYSGEGTLLERNIIKLDSENDRPVEEFRYYADGTLDQITLIRYNEKGKVLQTEIWEGAGHPTSKTSYIYDKNTDALKEVQSFDGQGKVFERIIYTNDSMGNPQKVYKYSVSNKFGEITNELKSTADYTFSY